MDARKSRGRFGALFHRAPEVSCRIAYPGLYMQWLDIAEVRLTQLCEERSWLASSYLAWNEHDGGADDTPTEPLPAELEDALLYATCVIAEATPAELDEASQSIQRAWRERIALGYARVLEVFRKQAPDLILLLQGFEPHSAVARCAALELGIPFLALENTALSDRMVWDNVSGVTTNRNLARSYYWRGRDRVSPETYEAYCERLIRDTRHLKSAEHRSPRGSVAPRLDRPTLLFLGQVYTDSSIVFGLRRWASPVDVLEHCVRWCQEHEYDLIVKLHPKEATGRRPVDDRPLDRLTFRKIAERPPLIDALEKVNAVVDETNQYNTYDLIDACALVVTVNSQAGLEAAIRGKPAVVCGDAFFGGLDFTSDAQSPAHFDGAMQEALSFGPTETSAARLFTYTFFEQYCREKSARALLELVAENL